MKRTFNTAMLALAAVAFFCSAGQVLAANQVTLNLVQQQSSISVAGYFTSPFGQHWFRPQEGNAGTTDLAPATPSTVTTYQGSITVLVDNVNNPSTIQILGSAADADASGIWLPEIPPQWVPGSDYESTSQGTDAPPAVISDYGVEIGQVPGNPSGGAEIAYGAYRDIVYNVTMPAAVAVAPVTGQFASTTQNFEISAGYFDYWGNAQLGVNLRGRSEEDGADDDNLLAGMSTYLVTNLPNNQREIKLTIPIKFSDIDADSGSISTFIDGQFVATLIVPEPSTFALSGLAAAFAGLFSARRRK